MRNSNPKRRLAGLFASLLFSSVAQANTPVTYTDYARVVHVERSYRTELIREPQRVCNRSRHGANDPRRHRQDSTTTISGDVIGGAKGHDLTHMANSHGNARTAFSAHAANAEHSHRHRPGRYDDNHRQSGRRHCTTTTLTREQQIADGYDVTYVYRGNQFETHTQRHPGKRIPVTITISAGTH